MGTFENLHVVVPCRACGRESERTLQIKYGACWLRDLHIGDTVRWGPNEGPVYGKPAKGRAWISAYSYPCPLCGDESDFADFAVIVEGSLLVGVVQAPVGNRFREDENEPLWLGTGELPQWEPL
jgi:endogenous inhibitor of DNA gyrase (YacG/DUF329 family)